MCVCYFSERWADVHAFGYRTPTTLRRIGASKGNTSKTNDPARQRNDIQYTRKLIFLDKWRPQSLPRSRFTSFVYASLTGQMNWGGWKAMIFLLFLIF